MFNSFDYKERMEWNEKGWATVSSYETVFC